MEQQTFTDRACAILTSAIKLKQEKNIDMFVEYAPHVGWIGIRIFSPYWSAKKDVPMYSVRVKSDGTEWDDYILGGEHIQKKMYGNIYETIDYLLYGKEKSS